MSLLTKASLVMTPNAIKESKIYSIIPSNGNGDLDFTRGTLASSTLTNDGGLIESVPYNLLTLSEQFDNNGSWVKTNSTISPNSINSPNGTSTADTFSGDGLNAFHALSQHGSSISGTTYTISIFAKKGTNNFIQLVGPIGAYPSGTVFANFDLNNGVVGSLGVGTTSSITDFSNGWYRCTMTATATATSVSAQFLLGLVNSATSVRAESNILTTNVYIWGAQVVQGSIPKDYFFTTDRLNVPRLNYESYGGCPSILLEPQRTNLVSYSEDFSFVSWIKKGLTTITANTTTSPDGTIDADTLNNASGSLVWDSGNTLQRDTLVSASTTYTFSVYVKSLGSTTFSIALRNQSTGAIVSSNIVPNSGWQRVTVTQTTTVNTSIGLLFGNTNGNVAIWGAQIEQGSYPTSYIPTTTGSVTRNGDVFTRNNIYTNGLITSVGGTWFIELNNNVAYIRDTFASGVYLDTTNGGFVNGFSIRTGVSTSQTLTILKYVSGTPTALYNPTSNIVKIAIKWNGTTADVFVNGVKQVSATAFTTTAMEFLNANATDVPKYIKSTMLFPTPLTDAECIAITQ